MTQMSPTVIAIPMTSATWPARSKVSRQATYAAYVVSRSPFAQDASPMSAVPAPSASRSSSSRRLERPPRVDDGRLAVALRQRQPGAVDRDPGRQPGELLLVDRRPSRRAGRPRRLPADRLHPALGVLRAAPRPRRPRRWRAWSRRTRCRARAGPGPPRRAAPPASRAAGAPGGPGGPTARFSSTRSAARSTSPPGQSRGGWPRRARRCRRTTGSPGGAAPGTSSGRSSSSRACRTSAKRWW